jgi:hypothetical protein
MPFDPIEYTIGLRECNKLCVLSPTGNKNNIFFEGGLNLLYRYFSTGRYSKKNHQI